MANYKIGTGVADITDPAINQGMQGMSDPSQLVTGVESHLYARAFVVQDQQTNEKVVIVIADIWAGTRAVKDGVLKKLWASGANWINEEQLLLCGTHTHSAPGGFSHYRIYEDVVGGFDNHTFICIVAGIVQAIVNANRNLQPGELYLETGVVRDCGGQRSKEAYDANPLQERQRYLHPNGQLADTDNEMLLLKFVCFNKGVAETIGVLNWYAIHPTDRGQSNTFISGDNKGYASQLYEQAMKTNYQSQKTFVAAFANSNAGDVSGNALVGTPPDGRNDKKNMQSNGEKQFRAASELAAKANRVLAGGLKSIHTYVNMGHVDIEGTEHRTWPAGLGLSFAAGSTVDGTPRIKLPLLGTVDSIKLREGIVEGDLSAGERTAQGTIIAALGMHFQKTVNTKDYEQGQRPKPLVFSPGLTKPPMAPNVLPLQLIKLGSLVVVGIPGEITAMAGRRLRESILRELADEGITHVALAAYANDYSQYITTAEEYAKQQYEGASTLYGPHTLKAYQQEFLKLARAIKSNQELAPGPRPSKLSANILKRITIRNNSDSTVKVRVYYQNDQLAGGLLDKMAIPQAEFFVPALADYAHALPDNCFFKMQINNDVWLQKIRKNKMVLINDNGQGEVTHYCPKFLTV